MHNNNDILGMKNIAIYGAGGLGREVACLIRSINEVQDRPVWNFIGFFDDTLSKGQENAYGKILGTIEELNQWPDSIAIVIAIGNSSAIQKIVDKINNPLVDYPNLIKYDNSFADEESFKIGRGNIIQGKGSISCNVQLGDFNILNGSVVLGHDVKIGSFNIVMPATRVSGNVTIGDMNTFGVNSTIIQGLRIGNNIMLGAGSVLMTKPKDGHNYIGVPAKRFNF